jgi:hypothetical protein
MFPRRYKGESMRTPVMMTALLMLTAAESAHAQARNQIMPGETLRGDLTATDLKDTDDTAMDLFQFRGEAGRSYTVTLRAGGFDTYLKIRHNGSTLHQDDDGAGGTDSQVTFTPSTTGTYEILAGTLRQAFGAYTISLAQGAVVAPVAARAGRLIRPGEILRGTLTTGSPKHDDNTPYEPFEFDGRAGQRVSIGMASDAFDSYLVLRQQGSNSNLDTNDDGGGGRSASITYTLPNTARYEIRANAVSGTAAGDFTLRLDDVGAPSAPLAATAQTIAYGRVVRGALTASDPRAADDSYYDLYRFTGRRGDRVRITMISAAFDAYLGLYRAGDASDTLASNDDGGEGTDSLITFTLPADGSYDVRANSLGKDATGDYTLGVGLD